MKKHLLMLFLLNKVTVKSDLISSGDNNMQRFSSLKSGYINNGNFTSNITDKERYLSTSRKTEETLPALKAYEETLPTLRATEESLPVLKAYEELLPVLKKYEQYFYALEENQKNAHENIELKKENEILINKAIKIEKQLKSKKFKMEKKFSNDSEIEDRLNNLWMNFSTTYLNYLTKIEQLTLNNQDKKLTKKEANILYAKTINLIKQNYPIEEQIKKLKKQKKLNNISINKKIKSLRFQQNEKMKKLKTKINKKTKINQPENKRTKINK